MNAGRDDVHERRPREPDASSRSYYGEPIINPPTWEARDIAGYLFLGGLAGASSVLAAGAHMTSRPTLARASKVTAAGAGGLSVAALVHDLGRPARFLNMLRVFKPTSPMSVGSWLLAGYVPAAVAAAASDTLEIAPRAGVAATAGAAAFGPAIATYTGALVSNTAVPAWHDGHRSMPLIFGASGASAAAGVGLLAVRGSDAEPARRLAVLASPIEMALIQHMKRGLDEPVRQSYEGGRAGLLMKAADACTTTGAVGALIGQRSRLLSRAAGAMLVAGSVLTRFGIFHAGMQSSEDPEATVGPQRARQASSDGPTVQPVSG